MICVAATRPIERILHCAQFKRGPKIFKKGTKRGPDFEQKGDLKGTKRGPKRGPKTQVVQKIKTRLHLEILRILNLDEEKTMFVFCFHLNKPTLT